MNNLIQLCTLVFLLSKGVYSRECNDCINFDKCPKALELALYHKNNETMRLFRDASCGFDSSGKKPIAKVCCSVFPTADNTGQIQETSEDRRISSHVNLKLLPAECGNIKGDRIVGGTVADLFEFPWMALISHRNRDEIGFNCGGSIISKRYILTAAHCVKNKVIAGVRVGEYDLSTDIDCQKGTCEDHIQDIPVEKAIVHEKYKGLPLVINDIALLRLAQDIDFNHRNVHRICLPTTVQMRNENLSNKLVTVTGWGLTETHEDSSILRKVDIPIHTAQHCSDLYNKYPRPGQPDATVDQLCAGSQNKDSCNGDSGGPLMLEQQVGRTFRYIQYGVVSHGPQNCGSDYPGVYTDVTKFMGWILDNMSP